MVLSLTDFENDAWHIPQSSNQLTSLSRHPAVELEPGRVEKLGTEISKRANRIKIS